MTIEIRIDPTRCRGHAICALLYSEGVELDRWGYGRVVDGTPQDRRSIKRALRAAAACPNRAVVVEDTVDRRMHLAEGGPDGG